MTTYLVASEEQRNILTHWCSNGGLTHLYVNPKKGLCEEIDPTGCFAIGTRSFSRWRGYRRAESADVKKIAREVLSLAQQKAFNPVREEMELLGKWLKKMSKTVDKEEYIFPAVSFTVLRSKEKARKNTKDALAPLIRPLEQPITEDS